MPPCEKAGANRATSRAVTDQCGCMLNSTATYIGA